MKPTLTIRMGAPEWTVTIHNPNGDTVFDLRSMDRTARGRFHGQFMSAVRRMMKVNH